MSDEEELTIAREPLPDLVLTGIALPRIDCVEATRQLKTKEPMASIHVVALTASMMQIDRARFERAGFARLIGKPIDVLRFPQQVLADCHALGSAA